MNKKYLVKICVVLCLIAFGLPFLFRQSDTSFLEIMTTSFTALGAMAAVLTLIIAVLLYQKFSIDNIVIERQTHKVLELLDLLYNKSVRIGANGFDFISRFSKDDDTLFKEKFYLDMAGMALITRNDDFLKSTNAILELCESYWMPKEIKKSAEFLEIAGFLKKIQPEELHKYAKLNFGMKAEDDDEWLKIVCNPNSFVGGIEQPTKLDDAEMLVNDYVSNKNILVNTIANWLSNNSNIELNHGLISQNHGGLVGVFSNERKK